MTNEHTAWYASEWIPAIIGLALIAVCIGWTLFELAIRPLLIPRAEIARLADELISRHRADAEYTAFVEEQCAWHRCETYEQGGWRRVRMEIRRRPRVNEDAQK
jgi:hypothetical protein